MNFFKETITGMRHRAGVQLGDLAAMSGVPLAQLQAMEQGLTPMTLEIFKILMQLLLGVLSNRT